MADEHRRRAGVARERADQRVDLRGVRGVELSGRLVGDEEPRPVRERGADRDALLLPARELARKRVAPVEQADALEQPCPRVALAPRRGRRRAARAAAPTSSRAGQLRRERARVVLVGVAERARAVFEERAAAQRAQVVAEHADGAGGRPVEPGEDAQQRALARAARPEDDEQLAARDVERQALQRDRRPLAARRRAGRGRWPRRRSPHASEPRRPLAAAGDERERRRARPPTSAPVEDERERRQRALPLPR